MPDNHMAVFNPNNAEAVTEPNKPVDMFVVRKYTFNGIEVLIQIDRRKKEVSLVEWNDKLAEYLPKMYTFNGRTVAYAKTWLKIFDAMSRATQEAIKELQVVEDEELKRVAEAVGAMNAVIPTK